jgi:hypothetical protein
MSKSDESGFDRERVGLRVTTFLFEILSPGRFAADLSPIRA